MSNTSVDFFLSIHHYLPLAPVRGCSYAGANLIFNLIYFFNIHIWPLEENSLFCCQFLCIDYGINILWPQFMSASTATRMVISNQQETTNKEAITARTTLITTQADNMTSYSPIPSVIYNTLGGKENWKEQWRSTLLQHLIIIIWSSVISDLGGLHFWKSAIMCIISRHSGVTTAENHRCMLVYCVEMMSSTAFTHFHLRWKLCYIMKIIYIYCGVICLFSLIHIYARAFEYLILSNCLL